MWWLVVEWTSPTGWRRHRGRRDRGRDIFPSGELASLRSSFSKIFYNLHKYILQFWQIYFTILTNTNILLNSDKSGPRYIPQRRAPFSKMFYNLHKYILQSWQICFTIWTNTNILLNSDKSGPRYIPQRRAGITDFVILNNILQFRQIHFTILTNIFYNFDKYILQFCQIHFTTSTNTLYNFDKYKYIIKLYIPSEDVVILVGFLGPCLAFW